MGFLIRIEDIEGNILGSIADPTSIVIGGLHAAGDLDLPLLWTIQWEDDTTLSSGAMRQFRQELGLMATRIAPSEHGFVEKLDRLAQRVESDPNLLLMFYGD